ncbi:hypothetical protein AB0399_12200 [Streptomyces sp. NPDC088194]|uniref:hypothetical protein n=1 Tax=Streptomyces sp. NPDC088194 TaxID=3154931 RepID=UPI00344EA070
MSARLDDVLAALVRCTGTPIADTGDEHERWPLYMAACGKGECLDLLFSAVALEPVPSVALGIVLHVLGTLPEAARPSWIARLPLQDNRDYATRRAREIGIHQSRDVTPLLVDENVQDTWSDWLQLLLAERSTEPAVLHRLARAGRTKRIRRLASAPRDPQPDRADRPGRSTGRR